MTLFEVWAPYAETVRLDLDGVVLPLTRATNGRWRAEYPAGNGARYGFLLDDDPTVLPDPRSPRQPDGVHARSAVHTLDPAGWTDQDWTGRPLAGSVFYELHIGTFTPEGTFDAAIERLGHLVDLGVTVVEVMPVNAFDGTHNWGYDGVLWYAVHESYGGPDGLQRFVNACHARGLAVCLDVVHNHLGPSGNYLPRFGPYLTEGRNTWGQSLNLDGPGSDQVRRHILDNALRWLREFHVDALRLDAVHALVDRTATHLLAELSAETERLAAHVRRPLTLIAESDLNDPRLITPRAAGGYGLTGQWNDDLHHAVHTAVSGERQGYYTDFGSLACLARTLTHGFFHAGTYSSFRGRRHGTPLDRSVVPGSALLAYTCTHDQVGNRALGDRPSAYLTDGQLAVKAALVLCSPFTPMLFMGEEWGARTPFQFFTSHTDPVIGAATASGRKAEFAEHGWSTDEVPDPQDPATFLRSKLDWAELADPARARLLDCYRALLALRRARPELTDPALPDVRVAYDERERWIVVHRGRLHLLCNLSEDPVRIPVTGYSLLSWEPATEGPTATTVPAHSFTILDDGLHG
ncbi:malto-oligosyltrehalose trehalohydrolase [Nocardia puris]|uniref:Malto-oligosyltrehalose trehalohydrolase n=1 Tax=Nocardia puris TaxID=208602 RepID=A0A366CWL4_9NOCA|nr:malto-oligosyltrehalose trehalohydrolase [Nocardia puris]MBF6216017.1 malto-oligosyltrehalose trehalohydrolase [Nocardia puris]MBF6370233.1 malto-oligosyltrehalose trehalohydrolase [Nocardia puris]MBF6463540.1 malto-oligosyltrehalose trehalohydrolase [Nocardia puris]RBO80127.1 maltooligosyl trehalose hydrolase [Nocardia puris]